MNGNFLNSEMIREKEKSLIQKVNALLLSEKDLSIIFTSSWLYNFQRR